MDQFSQSQTGQVANLSIPERVAVVDHLRSQGVKVVFACQQVGIPRPTYYWFKKQREERTQQSAA